MRLKKIDQNGKIEKYYSERKAALKSNLTKKTKTLALIAPAHSAAENNSAGVEAANTNDPEPNELIQIDFEKIEKADLILKALNAPLRKQIVILINKHKRLLTATEIYKELNLAQALASHHLIILRNEGIINAFREGSYVFYNINYKRVKEISLFATQAAGQSLDAADALNKNIKKPTEE